jgi:hypothetical protein
LALGDRLPVPTWLNLRLSRHPAHPRRRAPLLYFTFRPNPSPHPHPHPHQVTPGDGHLYFTFRPPWVVSRPLDTFYSLHPEQRSFQDPRLKLQASNEAQKASVLTAAEATLLASQASSVGDLAAGAVARPDLT